MRTRPLGFLLFLALSPLAIAGCECGTPDVPDGGDAGLPDGALPDGALPDGALPDGGPSGPVVTICPGDTLPPPASGTCTATPGGANLLITGDVLTPGEVFRGGQVLVDAMGSIACVGCDCSGEPGASGATEIVCPDGVISPGLINGHEHLRYVSGPPMMTAERYEHRQQWRESLDGHNGISAGGSSGTAAIQWEELRMAMAGVTAGNTNGGRDGFVRNLDEGSTEGLGPPQINYVTFPLGDIGGARPMAVDCSYGSLPTASGIAGDAAYTPHISEGITDGARNEFLCMRDGVNDIIQPNTAIIHGIGLLAQDIAEIANDGTTLIWSPRTNISLYGDTARVTLYDNLGVLIALGTDWMRSGSMNMLRELKCADDLNRDYLDAHFSDEQLWLMATRNAAVVTATDDAIGTLAPGLVADIAIYDASGRPDHRAVIDAEPEDVALVLRAGRPLFGEQAVVDAIESGCDPIDVCGQTRAACVMRELGMSYSALAGMNASNYPLFFCDGDIPTDEPSCIPARNAMAPLPNPEVNGSNRYTGIRSSTDADGDGIEDAMDNCARIFNPIRPLDNGAQADFDDDGVGDECDPCPLDADTSTCAPIDPNDRDRDMVPDTTDNCPAVANTDQADRDMDMIGDVCDACPDAPNPGRSACPGTVYDVKDGTVASGDRVLLLGSVVTAVGSQGFTMQVPTDHPDYVSVDNSGVYVYTGGAPALMGGAPITRGMTVDVDGQVTIYGGQTQLGFATVTVSASPGAIPSPEVVPAPPTIATGGARAAALEAVLVRVESVTVTNAALGMDTFEVASSLVVDPFLYTITPFVTMGEGFDAITGVLLHRDDASKLAPRDQDDYLAGAPTLAALTPALSYVRAGAGSGSTFPEALTVRLTRATGTPTVITLGSSSPANLMVTNVTIPAGSASAPVPVTGVTMGTYTLTATLGSDMPTAQVRVLGATEAATGFTLTPASVMVGAGDTVMFTVTLDIPSPAAGTRIDLSEDTSGTIPAMVIVPADAISATFSYVAPAGETTGTLTATLNGTAVMHTAALTVLPPLPGTLVINEVDYDQPSTDGAEFVELFNPGTSPVSLVGKQLILINGSGGTPYTTIDLSMADTELAPGGYLVVRTPGLAVASGALTIDFAAATNNIQNGAPDGIAVWDATAMTLVDALSYEGSIIAATIGGMSVSLVEGIATAAADVSTGPASLSRIPNGSDTNNAATDWAQTTCITAGAANMSCP